MKGTSGVVAHIVDASVVSAASTDLAYVAISDRMPASSELEAEVAA
jgi:hypothetical protein